MNGSVENENRGEGAESAEDRKHVSQSSVALSRAQSACMCTRGDGAKGEQANEAALTAVSRPAGRAPSCDDNDGRVLDCRQTPD
jgi:hypothetical protein